MGQRNFRRVFAIAWMVIAFWGCSAAGNHAGPPVHPQPSMTLPNPVSAVVTHCPELVCTEGDVPSCDFEQVTQGAEARPIVDRVHCSRSKYGTDCEERRAPDGDVTHNGAIEVLKFRCSGNPVECEMTGGNASWETTLDQTLEGGRPLQYPCRHPRPGPEPTKQAVPGPNTV